MLLDLRLVDEKGKAFHWDETSTEIRGALSDLVGSSDFQIQISIFPLGPAWEIKGHFSTHYPEKCSRCGYDMELSLDQSIHEIIFLEKTRPHKTQGSQSPQDWEPHSPFIIYTDNPLLDLKSLVHEWVASAHPPFPQCSDPQVCESRKYQPGDSHSTPMPGHPGFAPLRALRKP